VSDSSSTSTAAEKAANGDKLVKIDSKTENMKKAKVFNAFPYESRQTKVAISMIIQVNSDVVMCNISSILSDIEMFPTGCVDYR
jgi:hypothetical protein